MENLTRREMQKLLKGIAVLHTSQEPTALPSLMISAVTQLISSDITTLIYTYPIGPKFKSRVSEPTEAISAPDLQLLEQHIHQHPLFNYYKQTSNTDVRKISDFVTTRQFHRLALYNEFYRKVGVEHQLVAVLTASSNLVLSLTLNRSKKDFSENDRHLLTAIKPYLLYAYQNAEAVSQLQHERGQLRYTIERLRCGIVLLDRHGRVEVITERAQHWLAEYFDVPRHEADQLPESINWWIKRHRDLASHKGELQLPAEPLKVERAGTRLVVRLAFDTANEQQILLMDEEVTILSAAASKLLGITRRESEVLMWIAHGKSNAEISQLCGLKLPTVKKHLENIYQKLEVQGRTAATARALEVLNMRNL